MKMQKKLMTLAVAGALAAPGVALSQVTAYGILDLGFQNSKTAPEQGAKSFIHSGQHTGSRLGFRANEALGGGLNAEAVVEFDITADTGATTPNGMTQRQTYAGLSSKSWGSLLLGRQYTQLFHGIRQGMAVGYGTFGGPYVFTGIGTTGGAAPANGRASNAIKYTSPSIGGFVLGALWAFGEDGTPGNDNNNRYWDATATYAPGPFGVAVGHGRRTTDVGPVDFDRRWNMIAGNWDVKTFGVYGFYVDDSTSGATPEVKFRRFGVNGVFRAGQHNFYLSWARVQDRINDDADSDGIGAAYEFIMSKRSRLYAGLGRVSNDDLANQRLFLQQGPATPAGYNPRAFQVGMVHSF
jgi:general bacterial porin, GBP family